MSIFYVNYAKRAMTHDKFVKKLVHTITYQLSIKNDVQMEIINRLAQGKNENCVVRSITVTKRQTVYYCETCNRQPALHRKILNNHTTHLYYKE